VPVMVVAGALDPLFAAAMLEQQTNALRRGEREVHFRALPTEGHTLMVGEALPEVMAWLAERLGRD
jgi:predicted esterase